VLLVVKRSNAVSIKETRDAEIRDDWIWRPRGI
jgi:hypothetical protein